MSIDNILDSSSAGQTSPSASVNNVIEVLYGSDDPKKAYQIPNAKISKIEIKESFFIKLPTMKLLLNDTGTFFNDVGFQIGNIINIKITPVIKNLDSIPKPYINSKFVIQAINYYFEADKNNYIYEIIGMYAAEKYLNDICVWPITEIDALNLDKQYTSEQALNLICTRGGLKFVSELKSAPDDNMAWLNSSLSYSEFVDKIVKHAWIADDDMPLMFVDKDGVAHYNSINNICDNSIKAVYIQNTLYDMKYRNKSKFQLKKPSGYRTYNSVEFKNMGFIQNQGAYGIKTRIYNPYNAKELNLIEFTPFIPTNPAAVTLNDVCLREKEFHDNKIRIANISNKSPGQTDNFRYSFAKMHFKQTHAHYDYAPQHNESIKRSFYQQFAFLTVDAVNQPDYEYEPQQKISLGDKITIRTDSVANQGSIQSGNFIVTSLLHTFFVNSNYTVIITGVNDGINGIGQLKKESALNKNR
jgi:hypothetical protein